ncbi:phage tail length tape measure family protein [Agrobacterium rosae]|uniref:phage tail length tape measure family protein n=1 Tax=Agrobacterium rosae TaxID=1972867 RepID=UPI002A1110AF|nr:phage tail length tape measure family protein [Agrobacterium rosae]MDX8313004.1 phage tail length tape measure family protein [Agrobacterium rosae]
MNANLPKFAMVMTSDDSDLKRSQREARQEIAASKDSVASIGAAADAIQPSMDRLINKFAEINAPAANRNGRAADIVAYGQELDRLQAKFDPVFVAQQRYLQKIQEINEAQKFGAISASAAIDARIRETNAINAQVNNLERLAIARKRAAESAVAAVTVTPDRGSDIQAYGLQLDQMRAKYNPVFATLTTYKARLAEIREAHQVGAITADEMTAAITRQRQAALATVNVLKGRDASGGNDREGQFRRQNLTYQLFDVGQTAYMGMNPAMILAQQGPQILQLYAGQGGINTALKDFRTIASGAARAITPLSVGIAGLTAVVATGVIAYNGYLTSTKEVETAASGLGRAFAGSKTEMEDAARAGASAAGISVSSARSMEAQFLRTGRIGSDNFAGLIGISKDFGATIGTTTEEAGSMLAEMFADPAKAAETLYQKYGLIDAATARNVTNLAAQNRQSEAQSVLLKALPSQLADASEATTALGRAWDAVARAASNAGDNVGGFLDRKISGPTLEEQLAQAREAQERLSTVGGLFDFLNPGKAASIADAARLPELEERKRRQDEEAAAEQKRSADIARSRAASPLYEASPANARSMQEQRLRNEIETLKSARGAQGVDAGQNESAIEAKTRALDALINRQERSAELDRLDIQIANERNPLLRAELEARRTRIQLSAEEKKSSDIEAEAAKVRNRIVAETIASAQSQASDMKTEAEARARLNSLVAAGTITSADANRLLQEEATLRPLIAAAASAEGAEKERLNKIITDLKGGYASLAAEEKRASFNDLIRGQSDKLEQLRLEKILIGENSATRSEAVALLETEQKIRSMGLSATSREAGQIRELAKEQANLTREIERQEDAWGRVQQAGEDAIGGVVDKLSDGDLGGALDAVKDALTSFVKDDIKANLSNALLGTNKGTANDIGGITGIFTRLLGGGEKDPASLVSQALGQSVATMSVTAANVTINGGMAGGLNSLLGGAANDNSNVVQFPGSMSAFAKAIQSIESGGNYNALGPITRTGDRAYGAYQVMGANVPSWTKQALGQSLTPEQFLGNSAAQDSVFQKIFGGYVSKYGSSGAAQAWFGGPGSVGKGGAATDILGTSGTAYVQKFNAALGTATQSTNIAAQGLGNLGTGFSQFGQNMSSFFPSAPSGGGGGGFFSNLFKSFFGGGGLNQSILSASPQTAAAIAAGGGGLFDGGGWTGPGERLDVAGVVHADEFVFSKKAVQKIGVQKLDAMHKGLLRGYDAGGYASVGAVYPSAVAANSNYASGVRNAPIINNYGSSEVSYEEETDQHGNKQPVITIGQQSAAAVKQRGNPLRRAIQSEFGLKAGMIRR